MTGPSDGVFSDVISRITALDSDRTELDYTTVMPELGIPEGEGPDINTPIMAPVQTKVKKADTIKVKETPAQAQRKSVAQSRKKANTAGVSGVSSTGGSGISIVGV